MFSAYVPATIQNTEDFVLAADESNRKDNWWPEYPDFKMIRCSTFYGNDLVNIGVLRHKNTGEIKLVQSYDNGFNDPIAFEITIPEPLRNLEIIQLSTGSAYGSLRKKDHYAYFQNPLTKEKFLFDWDAKSFISKHFEIQDEKQSINKVLTNVETPALAKIPLKTNINLSEAQVPQLFLV